MACWVWGTLIIALAASAAVLAHLLAIVIPESKVLRSAGSTGLKELRRSVAAVRATQGLLALIVFSIFNSLTGGVYRALMDPCGLAWFPVEVWGAVLGVMVTGSLSVARWWPSSALGRRPLRTMLILVACTGAVFTLREGWWLYAVGLWLCMMLMPAVEVAEQTII